MCKSPAGFALNISHIYRRSPNKADILPQISVYSSALWCLQTWENCRIWGFHGDVSFWSYINVSNAHGTSNFRTEVLLVFPPCCHLIVHYRFGGLFRLHFWVHTTEGYTALQLRKWRKNVHPKCWYTVRRLHGGIESNCPSWWVVYFMHLFYESTAHVHALFSFTSMLHEYIRPW
jgi:hypothetical protein